MRKALVLVALSAACGDDGNTVTKADAAIDSPPMVIPDAPSFIEGTWKDTYYMTSGMMPVAACSTAPTAVRVDATTGSTSLYVGTCKADGSFKIDVPADLATYYLKVLGGLYESNARTGIDLSSDKLGRNNVSPSTGVTLHLNVNNMQPWTAADVLVAFGTNIGFRQTLSFSSGAPAVSANAVNGVVGWNGYQIDSTKGDQLQIAQLGKHTSASSIDYLTLDRVFYAPLFTMLSSTQSNVTGSFTSPDAGSLALTIDVDSFDQFDSVVAPSITTKSLQAVAFAAVTTDVIESPPLFSFIKDPTGLSTISFGTVAFGDPFPATWKRLVRIQESRVVPYTYNAKTGNLTALIQRVMTKNAADAGTVSANLGPVTNLMLDGTSALTATSISQVPLITWSAPTVGTPTDYEVQVYEVVSTGASLTFSSVLRLSTKSTSVRVPDSYLLGQRQYVIQVRARIREGVDVATTPLHNGTQYSTADAFSALVSTGS